MPLNQIAVAAWRARKDDGSILRRLLSAGVKIPLLGGGRFHPGFKTTNSKNDGLHKEF